MEQEKHEKKQNKGAFGTVRAVCTSTHKGTEKKPVKEGALFRAAHGIEGDAHAGNWHRQVSLLSYDKVQEFNARGGDAKDGAFGENLLVEGIDFGALPVGSILSCGDVTLRITQIGKECHTHCAIYHRVGDCIMPREGVFAEVLTGGRICPGDKMEVAPPAPDAPFSAAVVVMSDKGAAGEREDLSGPEAARILKEAGFEVIEQFVIPDEPELIKKELIRLSDQRQASLIITSGGTGMSMRDQTPEATLAVCDRIVPGIAEAIRAGSMQITKRAMLSRGVSAMRGRTLIVNLPGSPKAVAESLELILPVLGHGLSLVRGTDGECARS
ncbi:MAG: molybdopterin-binding protein [Eubacteriales bacterium]|nr:molybdopterin-binding protein [Eubacteriales bacterium]